MAGEHGPVFGENGAVLNAEAYKPWRQQRRPKTSDPRPIQNVLRRRDPHLVFILLRIIAAGPLNASMLFWILLGFLTGDFFASAVIWVVGGPSTVAVLFGATYVYRQDHNLGSILSVAFKLMGWTGFILASPSLLLLFYMPVVPFFIALFVLLVGGLAALAGAIAFRLVVYEWKPITPQFATP